MDAPKERDRVEEGDLDYDIRLRAPRRCKWTSCDFAVHSDARQHDCVGFCCAQCKGRHREDTTPGQGWGYRCKGKPAHYKHCEGVNFEEAKAIYNCEGWPGSYFFDGMPTPLHERPKDIQLAAIRRRDAQDSADHAAEQGSAAAASAAEASTARAEVPPKARPSSPRRSRSARSRSASKPAGDDPLGIVSGPPEGAAPSELPKRQVRSPVRKSPRGRRRSRSPPWEREPRATRGSWGSRDHPARPAASQARPPQPRQGPPPHVIRSAVLQARPPHRPQPKAVLTSAKGRGKGKAPHPGRHRGPIGALPQVPKPKRRRRRGGRPPEPREREPSPPSAASHPKGPASPRMAKAVGADTSEEVVEATREAKVYIRPEHLAVPKVTLRARHTASEVGNILLLLPQWPTRKLPPYQTLEMQLPEDGVSPCELLSTVDQWMIENADSKIPHVAAAVTRYTRALAEDSHHLYYYSEWDGGQRLGAQLENDHIDKHDGCYVIAPSSRILLWLEGSARRPTSAPNWDRSSGAPKPRDELEQRLTELPPTPEQRPSRPRSTSPASAAHSPPRAARSPSRLPFRPRGAARPARGQRAATPPPSVAPTAGPPPRRTVRTDRQVLRAPEAKEPRRRADDAKKGALKPKREMELSSKASGRKHERASAASLPARPKQRPDPQATKASL